ncbi:GNAT family N-acetyltransferase [Pantanalinema sp. GBBB05]|uniref:GNAT family N-acetyltransferase n=1 Tax=Pantanalinema sp. GBBB05 TaxID=2604139 RepID=UPI003D81757D
MSSSIDITPSTQPMADVQIIPVTTPAEQELFLDVPAIVYANDPNWVPPLRSSVAKQLAPTNPFFQYGKLQQFLAIQKTGDRATPVGRVVAAVNQRLIDREGEQIGLFGFFECVHDFAVAQALLNAAEQWLREQGMTKGRGPINLSTHNSCLFLVDGFDSPPAFMMPYNPAYYPQFMEQAGWQKAKDAYAYDFRLDKPLLPKFEKAYQVAIKSGITFRPFRTTGDGFQQDCIDLYHLFTKAFANNWSSTPRSQEDFLDEAKDLQSLVDPTLFPIAEANGEMIGFFMCLPDYSLPLKYVNGKLNWLGILKFLWYKRQIHQGRVIAICALPEYRRQMVALALIYLGMQGGIQRGYQRAELSWVYEDNMPSRKVVEASGGTIYKTYRIYQKELGTA